jgi:hypothetical protein
MKAKINKWYSKEFRRLYYELNYSTEARHNNRSFVDYNYLCKWGPM